MKKRCSMMIMRITEQVNKIYQNNRKICLLALQILEWLAFAVSYLIAVRFIDRYIDGFLDLDLSAELVSGNILSEEGGIITKDWIFSTELRVLNVPLVFSIIFHFFYSWHTVRVISSAILLLILAGSALYLAYSLGLGRIAPLLAMVIVLPFSPVYMLFVTCGLYYIPHIAISLFTIGMVYRLSSAGKVRRIVILIILGLLAAVAGMGGIRMVANLYLPLICVLIIIYIAGYKMTEKNRFPIMGIVISFIFSLIGLFINGRLHAVYEFNDRPVEFIHMVGTDIADRVINPILNCFSYSDTALDLWTLVRNSFCGLSIIMVVVALIFHMKGKKEKEVFLSLFFIMNLGITIVIFLFTETQFRDRYYLPVIFWGFILIAGMFWKMDGDRPVIKVGFSLLYLMLICLSSYNVYKIYKYLDITSSLREAEEFLVENDFTNGYAGGFGVQITELSDGKIDVWNWDGGDIDNQKDIDEILLWLQKKSHMTEKPEGKVFVILNTEQYSICPFKDRVKDYQIYDNDEYVIFGFDDYSECRSVCNEIN